MFSSVQWLSRVRLFVTPWIAAHQASAVHHHLPEFTQTHAHRVRDAISTNSHHYYLTDTIIIWQSLLLSSFNTYLLHNYCMLLYGIMIINKKKKLFLGCLWYWIFSNLPTVFSSCVVPDCQAAKTLVKPNSLRNDLNGEYTAIWHNLGWRLLCGEFNLSHWGWLLVNVQTALKGFYYKTILLPVGEGSGNLLQYSCLENPMDRGACQATVHGVARVRHDLATKPCYVLINT